MATQQPKKQNRRSQYARLFTIMTIALIIISAIHFASILTSGPATENIADTIYHLVMAAGFLGVSRLVKGGKRTVIYLLGLIGVIAVSYGLMMERGFNLILIVVIAFFIWQMLNLAKNGELA